MPEQSAPALGRSLVRELARLRVETLVASSTEHGVIAQESLGGPGTVAPRGPSEPIVGDLPPTNPAELFEAVRDRFDSSPRLETVADSGDVVDPEVAARRDAALTLLHRIDPRTDAVLETVGGPGPPEPLPQGVEPQLDQNIARRLARHWELGQRSVACRTLVRMDGDAVTQFPTRLPGGQAFSHKELIRVHGAIAMAAMAVWPVLFLTAGRLVAAFLPQAPRLDVLLWWRSAPQDHARVDSFPLREFAAHCRSFLAWGRVVFESPASGGEASIRSMLHPSGDIETTILRDATDDILQLHAGMVSTWIRRMEASLRLYTAWLEWISLGLWSAITLAFGGLGYGFTRTVPWAVAVAAAGFLAGWSLRLLLRRLVQQSLVALKSVAFEKPQTGAGP